MEGLVSSWMGEEEEEEEGEEGCFGTVRCTLFGDVARIALQGIRPV